MNVLLEQNSFMYRGLTGIEITLRLEDYWYLKKLYLTSLLFWVRGDRKHCLLNFVDTYSGDSCQS